MARPSDSRNSNFRFKKSKKSELRGMPSTSGIKDQHTRSAIEALSENIRHILGIFEGAIDDTVEDVYYNGKFDPKTCQIVTPHKFITSKKTYKHGLLIEQEFINTNLLCDVLEANAEEGLHSGCSILIRDNFIEIDREGLTNNTIGGFQEETFLFPWGGEDPDGEPPPPPGSICAIAVDCTTLALKLAGEELTVDPSDDCIINWDGACVTAPLTGTGKVGDCLDLDINCGLKINAGQLEVDNTDLVDPVGGLEVGAGSCDLKIKLDSSPCTFFSLSNGGLKFLPTPLVGNGLVLDGGLCKLNILIDPVSECNALSVTAAGLKFTKPVAQAGKGLVAVANCGLDLDVADPCDALFLDGENGNKLTFKTANIVDLLGGLTVISNPVDVCTLGILLDNASCNFFSLSNVGLKFDPTPLQGAAIILNGCALDVRRKRSIIIDADELMLAGDLEDPGIRRYWGTASNGLQAGKGFHQGDLQTVVTEITNITVSGTTVTINYKDKDVRVLDNTGTETNRTALGSGGECTT